MRAHYEIRNIVRLSATHLRLEARFEAPDGTVLRAPGVADWELIDINPFRSAEDVHAQLVTILEERLTAYDAVPSDDGALAPGRFGVERPLLATVGSVVLEAGDREGS